MARKKHLFGMVFLLLAFATIFYLSLLYVRMPPAFADFTGFKSEQSLNGSRIKSTKLVRTKERGLDVWRFDYIQEYESGVVLYQRKVREFGNAGGCTGSTRGDLSSMDVSALIDETEFYIAVPKEQLKTLAAYNEWQQYFDTVEPVNLQTMPFEKRESTPLKG